MMDDVRKVNKFTIILSSPIFHGGGYEDYGLLGCNTMYFGDRMFRRKMSSPSSRSRSKLSMKIEEAGNKPAGSSFPP
jgi:hypothetical protein